MKIPMQDIIKTRIEKWLNCKIYRYSLPRGVDFAYDAKRILPRDGAHTIFDVGANIGQSVVKFRDWYPQARILSFEPVAATFKELGNRVGQTDRVELFQLAMGDEMGEKWIYTNEDPTSSINSFVRQVNENSGEMVLLNTLDSFCASRGIDVIDVLKIDVEGYELKVLNGGKEMLGQGKVKFLYIETALRDEQHYFTPLASLDSVLRPLGYDIFGVYEQQTDVKRKIDHLYFCNIAYVHREFSRAYKS